MARQQRFYYQQRRTNRRRVVLACFLALAGGAVAWKFYSEKTDAPSNITPTLPVIASQLDVPVEPPVTTPERIVQQVRQAVQNIQPVAEPAAVVITKSDATETDVLELGQPPVTPKAPERQPESLGYEFLQQGREAIKVQDYISARQLLSDAVEQGLNITEEKRARQLINQVSDEWMLSRKIFENDEFCSRYKVADGDMLVNIGKNYDVPYQLIMKINGIRDASRLRVGQMLKIVRGPFHLVVQRHRYLLSVYLGDILVRSYPVGLGSPGRQTPTGLWRVRPGKKQVDPAWTDVETGKHYYSGDPENPLGKRWISLEGIEGDAVGRDGFGIHGTIKPHEIGQSTSRGCIRLHNKNVIELYDLLGEGVSDVRVID